LLRVASAAVGLPLLGLAVFAPEPMVFTLVVVAACTAALVEYAGMAFAGRPPRDRVAVVLAGAALLTGLVLRPDLGVLWAMGVVVILGTFAVIRADPADLSGAVSRFGLGTLGAFYVGGLGAALPLLKRAAPDGSSWVVVAFAVTFVNDSGAYFVGRAAGKRRLAPAISPGKTVEGGLGGLIAGLAFMFIARATFFAALTPVDCVVVGAAAGVLGPVGDLVESLLKRSAGVKDSGRLLPGHGGMLDRIDAVLFVGAFVLFYVTALRG
jgi:phosphatidate cytidylyltransferase